MALLKPFHTYSNVLDKISRLYKQGEKFVFALDYHKTEGFCLTPEEAKPLGILWQIAPTANSMSQKSKLDFEYFPIVFEDYQLKFDQVIHHIKKGNTYLCNLTQQTPVKLNLSLSEIYNCSQAKYKLYVPDYFVVFSPESFIAIKGKVIFTYPMKGTLTADLPENHEKLKSNPKENAEHNTIVDLLRNDLSQVADQVKVERLKYIEKIQTHKNSLWQMSSAISGKVKEKYQSDLGGLLDKLLPAGSVTGAPKLKTVEILNDIEKYNRGFYTGIFGYYDGMHFNSAVMIRFIEKNSDQFYYKSGGGITFHSNVMEEYNELIQKIYVPVF